MLKIKQSAVLKACLRENKSVAVHPFWVLGVEVHNLQSSTSAVLDDQMNFVAYLVPEDVSNGCHTHWRTRVA